MEKQRVGGTIRNAQSRQVRDSRMIGRKFSRKSDAEAETDPKWFDDFDVSLGDLMRGERATMGKSLLDVQRELRIKASYIAAIENCDPSAFDTPGFIAGYVRSYARYLNMDPDKAFATFCAESGFSVAHGMSEKASVVKKASRDGYASSRANESEVGFARSPFAGQPADSFLSSVEPRAVGSALVLLAIIGGLVFGGWSLLKEVQRVQVAPVDQAPVVLSNLDPVGAAGSVPTSTDTSTSTTGPTAEALDRLYRPQALDAPVLVPRDAAIATIDPRTVGSFVVPEIDTAAVEEIPEAPSVPQVVEAPAPGVMMVAVRPAWVRVRAADGTVIFEKIMESGEVWDVPLTEEPPSLRVGESGSIYFRVNGQHYGPAGTPGTVTAALSLSVDNLSTELAEADMVNDQDLAKLVAELETGEAPAE